MPQDSASNDQQKEIKWRNYKLVRPPSSHTHIKGIGASTRKDLHGEQLSLEQLRRIAEGLQKRPFMYNMHDASKPPIGKGVSWDIRQEGDTHVLEIEYIVWDENAVKEIKEGKIGGLSVGWTEKDERED